MRRRRAAIAAGGTEPDSSSGPARPPALRPAGPIQRRDRWPAGFRALAVCPAGARRSTRRAAAAARARMEVDLKELPDPVRPAPPRDSLDPIFRGLAPGPHTGGGGPRPATSIPRCPEPQWRRPGAASAPAERRRRPWDSGRSSCQGEGRGGDADPPGSRGRGQRGEGRGQQGDRGAGRARAAESASARRQAARAPRGGREGCVRPTRSAEGAGSEPRALRRGDVEFISEAGICGAQFLAGPAFLASFPRCRRRCAGCRRRLARQHAPGISAKARQAAAGVGVGRRGTGPRQTSDASRGPPAAYCRGAPNASGIRSIVYLRFAMYIIGTPGTLRILRLRSRSHVATI